MKLDVKTDHPFNLYAKVTLDGVPQQECVACCNDEGYVDRYKKDASGKLVVENDELVIERIWGKVEITIPEAILERFANWTPQAEVKVLGRIEPSND